MSHRILLASFVCALACSIGSASAAESLWLEAEHFDGIKGFCWPLGTPAMKKTAGNWGLSGPGWAAEWNQGGESGFLSIATAGDDDKATVSKTVEIPVAGTYHVWVRYGDWREKPERFEVHIEQPGDGAAPQGTSPWVGKYGERAIIEEDNEMKLYFGWAFAWDSRPVELKAGQATIKLATSSKDPEPRQIDVVVLSTDAAYRPRIKDRPANPAWEILAGYRKHGVPRDLEPLARRAVNNQGDYQLPEAWRLKTFRNEGFYYLWNVNPAKPYNWLSDDPKRVLYPYQVADDDVRTEFEAKYAGAVDVPIFSDKRIVPTFHGVGAGIFATDPKTGELSDEGTRFAKWLVDHPDRRWAMMSNYHPGKPIGEKGQAEFAKVRDRFLGSISGEALSPQYPSGESLKKATEGSKTRRQLVEAFTPLALEANAAMYRKVYGKDLDPNSYADIIACLSVGNIAFVPICADWGARTVGYESSSMSSSVLAMRWAFMRGGARQRETMTATYRSCNFGDASTIFSKQQSYTSPRNFLDNYYSVFSGAGMTWYKFDIWYQYMAGASMFYHEQGFDEFWKPGGLTAAGIKEVQLSPKGQLVDRFLRVTAREPDRGVPFTPVAFLVDYAHGWEPAPFWPNSFKNYHHHEDRFRYGDHEKMLEEYLWTAYYPIGPESEKPMTGTNEVNLPAVFGDQFDVIFAYPDVKKWRTIDSYPVVIVAGEIELTAAEGERLAQYVEQGGTLLVADAHLTGPGVAALKLPAVGAPAEADGYRWLADAKLHPSPRFRYRAITEAALKADSASRSLATTADGKTFCLASDRGKGRLIYLTVPHGMSISRQAVPVVTRLIAHLTRGLMPVEVEGDVEWLVNRTSKSWLVTLLNPAGQVKPQQGITPTDYRENRTITIRAKTPVKSARDRLLPDDPLKVDGGTVKLEVPAGAVRVIELE